MSYVIALTMIASLILALECAIDFQVYHAAAQECRKRGIPGDRAELYDRAAAKIRKYGLYAMALAVGNGLYLAYILGGRS